VAESDFSAWKKLELYVVRSNRLSDDLFKVALGAALAATNLMIIEGSLIR
jgi:hypothetical protein